MEHQVVDGGWRRLCGDPQLNAEEVGAQREQGGDVGERRGHQDAKLRHDQVGHLAGDGLGEVARRTLVAANGRDDEGVGVGEVGRRAGEDTEDIVDDRVDEGLAEGQDCEKGRPAVG